MFVLAENGLGKFCGSAYRRGMAPPVGFDRPALAGACGLLASSSPRTWRLPPPSTCLTVFVPFQLLANHNPPFLSQMVMAIESAVPGSPRSATSTRRVALPSMVLGASGSVMSWMLALPLKVDVPPALVCWKAVGVRELPLTWYTRPPLRTIVLRLLRESVSLPWCLTLNPKLFLVPAPPA